MLTPCLMYPMVTDVRVRRLSFDKDGAIAKAIRFIELYEKVREEGAANVHLKAGPL